MSENDGAGCAAWVVCVLAAAIVFWGNGVWGVPVGQIEVGLLLVLLLETAGLVILVLAATLVLAAVKRP